MTNFEMVREFHEKVFNEGFRDKPVQLDDDLFRHRTRCMMEELTEFLGAKTIADQADAMIDLIYFAYGTLYKMGVDADQCFSIVHSANMQKTMGVTKRGHDDDAAKPEGWTPPNLDFLNE